MPRIRIRAVEGDLVLRRRLSSAIEKDHHPEAVGRSLAKADGANMLVGVMAGMGQDGRRCCQVPREQGRELDCCVHEARRLAA
jgi:hypothetical protein